jgi:hypothetical protein
MTFVFPKENVGADGVSPVLLADCALEPWPSWPRSHRPSELRRAEVASKKDKLVIVQRGHDTTLLFSKKNALSPLASGLGRLRPATLAVASGIPARFPAKFCSLTRERNQRSAVWACCELDSGDDHRDAEFYLQ